MKNTVWKFTVESIAYSIWKENVNYNMSFLIPQQTVLHDSGSRREIYVFALLRFDNVKVAPYRKKSKTVIRSTKRI